jgi:hypothetical protein
MCGGELNVVRHSIAPPPTSSINKVAVLTHVVNEPIARYS